MSENKTPSTDKEIWDIESWEQFRRRLSVMTPRSKLYTTIQAEMVKRGHWRVLRGRYKR